MKELILICFLAVKDEKKTRQNTSQIRNNKHGIAEIGTTWFLCMYIFKILLSLKIMQTPPPQKIWFFSSWKIFRQRIDGHYYHIILEHFITNLI